MQKKLTSSPPSTTAFCMGEIMFYLFHLIPPKTPKEKTRAAQYHQEYKLHFATPGASTQIPWYYLEQKKITEARTLPTKITAKNKTRILKAAINLIQTQNHTFLILHLGFTTHTHGIAFDRRNGNEDTIILFDSSLPNKTYKFSMKSLQTNLSRLIQWYEKIYAHPLSEIQIIQLTQTILNTTA